MHRNHVLSTSYEPRIRIYISNDFVIYDYVFITQFLLSINYNVLLSSDLSLVFVNKKKISDFELVSNKYIVNDVMIDMDEEVEMAMRTIL